MTQQHKAGSFDAFWAEVSGGATETIRGVVVAVPTDMPIAMEMRITQLQESGSEQDIRELLSLLFGDDVLDEWTEAGMGMRELQTVLTWGIAHASGKPLTFQEAYDALAAAEDAAEGKAPNRAARRAAQSKPSASTGGRSKRTSAVSTASTRARSRT